MTDLADRLGSTSQLTNSAGALTDRYAYDVYGAVRSQTGTTANDFRFTGQQHDSNAQRRLYYLRARAYDPALGRFLQRDPLPLLNEYAYVGNNPVNLTDPYGLWPHPPCPACDKIKHAVRKLAVTAVHDALSTAAVPPYALYYVAYQEGRAINYVGSQFGTGGVIVAHVYAAPLVVPEAIGLGGDVAIDFHQRSYGCQ
ncbi:MAG TPA: RHS repeat-associated core domain-containing protein [Dehalococcoidia bacterium]|nr:RHS repeat-associated core domain-containing protein [Dehalococcoidia bacterium]